MSQVCYECEQEAEVLVMCVGDVLDGCDVFGEAEAVVDVEGAEVLQVLDELRGVEVDEHRVLLHLEPVHREERVAALLHALQRFALLHQIYITEQLTS